MPLFEKYQISRYSEEEMEIELEKFILKSKFTDSNFRRIQPMIFRQFSVKEVGRRSDLVVYFSKNKVFNIECKLNDFKGVITQALDHKKWANYSIVCMPDNCWLSTSDIQKVIDNGLGLILYNRDLNHFTEVVIAQWQRHSNKKGPRKTVIERLEPKFLENLHGTDWKEVIKMK